MNTTTIDPNDAARAWTRRCDGVAAITAILVEGDVALDGSVEEAFDVEGLADEVLTTQGAGYLYRYVLGVEDDEFWAAVARHAR